MSGSPTSLAPRSMRVFRSIRSIRSMIFVASVWILIQLPNVAQACSVCTAGRDEENQTAFLLSTIFMSLLPLIAIGTLVFVLWRRIQKLEADVAETRTES